MLNFCLMCLVIFLVNRWCFLCWVFSCGLKVMLLGWLLKLLCLVCLVFSVLVFCWFLGCCSVVIVCRVFLLGRW